MRFSTLQEFYDSEHIDSADHRILDREEDRLMREFLCIQDGFLPGVPWVSIRYLKEYIREPADAFRVICGRYAPNAAVWVPRFVDWFGVAGENFLATATACAGQPATYNGRARARGPRPPILAMTHRRICRIARDLVDDPRLIRNNVPLLQEAYSIDCSGLRPLDASHLYLCEDLLSLDYGLPSHALFHEVLLSYQYWGPWVYR